MWPDDRSLAGDRGDDDQEGTAHEQRNTRMRSPARHYADLPVVFAPALTGGALAGPFPRRRRRQLSRMDLVHTQGQASVC